MEGRVKGESLYTFSTVYSSDDKDESPDGTSLGGDKEVISAQNLTIVEEDGSLGSAGEMAAGGDTGEDQAAVAGLAHTQGILDPSSGVQYQFRAENGQGGQFYVIGSPQDVFGTPGQRTIAPRTGQLLDPSRGGSSRDERRRATHNEVERRRRDKINNWIIKLSKIIPDCAQDHTKQGQVSFEGQVSLSTQSKGGILAKACEYIVELRSSNQRLAECLKDNERLTMDVEVLRQQNEELKRENVMLRTQLQQHGIIPTDMNQVNS